MDIRTVETVGTSGSLNDTVFRIDPTLETTSLDWDNTTGTLSLVDYNVNYNILPHQIGTDMVKKTFLTYNGGACSGQLLETLLVTSSDDSDINQIPGYNNSNEWSYTPASFQYPAYIQNISTIGAYLLNNAYPAPGYTILKQFLSVGGSLVPATTQFAALYQAPAVYSVKPANLDGGKLFKDGWYTSYVAAVKTWNYVNPVITGSSVGDIVFYEALNKFYINLTGNGGTLTVVPGGIDYPDVTNWRVDPSFDEWKTLMRNNTGVIGVNDPIYFIESQHLVTVDVNMAIRKELIKNCVCCDKPKYGMSEIDLYMKLVQKRLGAWIQFNSGMYHDAACILASVRDVCDLVIKNCNTAGKC